MIVALLVSLLLMPPASPVSLTKVSTPEKALKFEVVVPGSLDDVWAAFATSEGLSTWLWRDTRVELRSGGDWVALLPGGKTAGGSIVAFEPRRSITMKAMAPEQFPTVRATRTTARFDFAAVTPSSTRVTLTQTGWREGPEWDEAYEYLAAGNATLLEQLHARFVRGPLKWPAP